MEFSNLQQEEVWLEAYSNLLELKKEAYEITFLLPDWREVSQEDCLGWLQDSAYQSYYVFAEEVWYKGKKAIQVSRKKA